MRRWIELPAAELYVETSAAVADGESVGSVGRGSDGPAPALTGTIRIGTTGSEGTP